MIKMNITNIDIAVVNIIIGVLLVILVSIQTYSSLKLESKRQETERLYSDLASNNLRVDSLLGKYERLFTEMTADNNSISVLKDRIMVLDYTVEELKQQEERLRRNTQYLERTNAELCKSNSDLADKCVRLRGKIEDGNKSIEEMGDYIDSLKIVKEGLETAVSNFPVEEVPYLSTSIFAMGVTPSISHKLEGYGILYVGDIINLSEQYLIEIWGVGPVNLERIKNKLKDNDVWFGMDVIRVNNRWYRRKCNLISE